MCGRHFRPRLNHCPLARFARPSRIGRWSLMPALQPSGRFQGTPSHKVPELSQVWVASRVRWCGKCVVDGWKPHGPWHQVGDVFKFPQVSKSELKQLRLSDYMRCKSLKPGALFSASFCRVGVPFLRPSMPGDVRSMHAHASVGFIRLSLLP